MSVLQEVKVLKEVANEDISTAAKIYYKNGGKVKEGNVILELETSKAVFMVEAEKEGYVRYFCKEGDDVAVGAVIARIYDNKEEIEMVRNDDVTVSCSKTLFSSAAMRLIEKEKLDKNVFSGRDFVSLEDVQNFLSSTHVKEGENGLKDADYETGNLISSGQVRLQNISKAKQLEILSLTDIQSANMNCVIATVVNVGGILKFVQRQLNYLNDSLLPIVVFEVSRLLKEFPEFNSFFTKGGIALYNTVGIGLAVDIGQGLKVVKIANADQKNIKEIESEILLIANKYLDKKLTLDDVSGITFTITDLSKDGVVFFTPLINKRQSAILGISSVDEMLNRCILTLTFDHRVSEGKRAAEFLNLLKIKLEKYGIGYSKTDEVSVDNSRQEFRCYNCLMTLEDIRRLKGIGLLKVVDCDQKEKLLCETCFLGWR